MTATAITMTASITTETTKLIFRTVHGSMCLITRRARRGPRLATATCTGRGRASTADPSGITTPLLGTDPVADAAAQPVGALAAGTGATKAVAGPASSVASGTSGADSTTEPRGSVGIPAVGMPGSGLA